MRGPLRALVPGWISIRQIAPGLAVAIVLAVLARSLAEAVAHGTAGLPRLPLSPVLYAVLLGMLWRNTVGVPAWTSEGLHWAMHRLLRTGIALVGLRLTLSGASVIAATALPVALACLLTALGAGILIARALAVPRRLGILLAVGTAVCGCTAVVAISPVIRARHAETAFAVTCVVLFGCTAMLLYPWIAGYFFGNSPVHAGVFLGTAIHDTSQVIGSALIYSQQAGAPDALSAASVAKLLRNLSIAVLIPAAAWLTRRGELQQADGGTAEGAPADGTAMPNGDTRSRRSGDVALLPGTEAAEGGGKAPIKLRGSVIPFFVVAFILCVVLRTAGDAWFGSGSLWHATVSRGQSASELFLICGMTAVGLSVAFADMWRIGWRPLAAGFMVATLVGVCSLSMTLLVQRLLH